MTHIDGFTLARPKNSGSFVKGQVGNPKGGRIVGSTVLPKEIKQYNSVSISHTMAKYISKTVAELAQFSKDKDLPVLDMLIVRILAKAIEKADQTRFNFILERMIGKVPDKIDHISSDGSLSPRCLKIEFVGVKKDDNQAS